MSPYTVGSRAIYAIFGRDRRQVVTITDITHTGDLSDRFSPGLAISIKLGVDGPVIKTYEDHLFPYKTPSFPPGILLTDQTSNDQQDEVEEYMESLLGEEELQILNEMNEDTIAEIKANEARDYALQGMSSDMDSWEDIGNMKENYHRLLARSNQGNGIYLYNNSWKTGYHYDSTHGSRECFARKGLDELDNRNRILVEAVVNKKGHKYVSMVSEYGKIFCDLKFTKYLPNEGEKVNCVVGIRGPESKLPLKCYHIPQ